MNNTNNNPAPAQGGLAMGTTTRTRERTGERANGRSQPARPKTTANGSPAKRGGRNGAPRAGKPTGLRLIGYIRVSTLDQADEASYGLPAQVAALQRWAEAAGHELITVVPEVASTRNPARMFGRLAVEAALRAGLADAMAVRDLDRASRSTLDGAELTARATSHGWRIVGTDGTDTADPEQEFLVNIRLARAQEERRLISRRTREGLEIARTRGAKVGRPKLISRAAERRIVKLRREGMSPGAIANHLTAKKIATPGGGFRWHASTVRAVLAREGIN